VTPRSDRAALVPGPRHPSAVAVHDSGRGRSAAVAATAAVRRRTSRSAGSRSPAAARVGDSSDSGGCLPRQSTVDSFNCPRLQSELPLDDTIDYFSSTMVRVGAPVGLSGVRTRIPRLFALVPRLFSAPGATVRLTDNYLFPGGCVFAPTAPRRDGAHNLSTVTLEAQRRRMYDHVGSRSHGVDLSGSLDVI
jgi:hypothetical protein